MSDELLEAMGALPFVAELERLVSDRVMAIALEEPRLQVLPALDVQRLVSLTARSTVVTASELLERQHGPEDRRAASWLARYCTALEQRLEATTVDTCVAEANAAVQ